MNIVTRIRKLPIPLIYAVSTFNPRILFVFGREQLVKFDWFLLMRNNFGLIYSKGECTNEEIMMVYLKKCLGRKSNIFVTAHSSSVLRGGRLMRCGINRYGGLGVGDCKDRLTFEEVGVKNIVEVKGNEHYSFIRLGDGTVMSCGLNVYGQLGHGDYRGRERFTEVKGVGKDVEEIICRTFHVIIRLRDGTLMVCGTHEPRELYRRRNNKTVFEEIRGIPKNVEKVMSGEHHIIIKLADGRLMSCGANANGQLGLGDFVNREEFCEVKGIGRDVEAVACGNYHSVVRFKDGSLMSCGYNMQGQLGLGDMIQINVFTKINWLVGNIVEVYCRDFYTIIRFADGTLMTSYLNLLGPLCFVHNRSQSIFYEIKEIPKNIVEVIWSGSAIIIRLTDGTLMHCPTNYTLGSALWMANNKFLEIKGIGKNIAEVALSSTHIIVRFTDGRLMAYGINESGQLRLGHTEDRDVFEVIKKSKPDDEKRKRRLKRLLMVVGGVIAVGVVIKITRHGGVSDNK